MKPLHVSVAVCAVVDPLDPFAVHLVHYLNRFAVGGHEHKATAAANAVQLREKNRVFNDAKRSEEVLEFDPEGERWVSMVEKEDTYWVRSRGRLRM